MMTVFYPTGERLVLWLPQAQNVSAGGDDDIATSLIECERDGVLLTARVPDLRVLFGVPRPTPLRRGGYLIEIHYPDRLIRFRVPEACGFSFQGVPAASLAAEFRTSDGERRRVAIRDPRSFFEHTETDVELDVSDVVGAEL